MGRWSCSGRPPWSRPYGESRPNYAVFADLIRRMELTKPGDPETPDEIVDCISRTMATEFVENDGIRTRAAAPILFVDAFPGTPDAKVHLFPPELDAEARRATSRGLYEYREDPQVPSHPLALISPATSRTISSTFGQLLKKPATVAIHPTDAQARSIADGDRVKIWNDEGEVICQAHVTDEVRPGVMDLPKGLWLRHTENGRTANALAPSSVADLGGGATYNDARVQVAPMT